MLEGRNLGVAKDKMEIQNLSLEPCGAAPGHVSSYTTEDPPGPSPDETAEAEGRDVVPELPSPALSGKGRRLRSETESRSFKGTGFFVPFKGRKRSHTLQEVGAAKEKEDVEDVSLV
jgi:hypothetical protein